MSYILHRQLQHPLPVAVGGSGVEIVDAEGRRYLDACGGAAVSCLGYGHPDVLRAMHEQIDRIAYAHTNFFTTEVAEELAALLVETAPPGTSHAYFVSGGSEAVEAAMKMARQYFVEIGQPERQHFIGRRMGYHGNTLGALAVGGDMIRRRHHEPLLMDATLVSPCYEYRDRRDDETPRQYGERLVRELSETIERIGPQRVIAFLAETVVGATAGALPPVPGYLQGVRELCTRHGILLILDEVMCGMGRTGTLHACEQEDVVPDLLTVSKCLGAGYQPIGAVLAQRRIVDTFVSGSGLFQHGHTYIGHPTACAAALAVQRVIRRDKLLDAVKRQGAGLFERLHAAFDQHPHVGDIRGRGLFAGVELVASRADKQPFDPKLKLNAEVKRQAMARGLMIFPGGGTIDGQRGDHVLLAPPFIVNDTDLDNIVERLKGAIDAAVDTIRAAH
jgi:adenosylmethionine-8-amino-7-oxononanoate aminotransferase